MTDDDLVNYDLDCLMKAIRKWLVVCMNDDPDITADALKHFNSFIGFSPEKGRHVPTHRAEVRRLIDMINGPNGHTVLKIMAIRKLQEDEYGPS